MNIFLIDDDQLSIFLTQSLLALEDATLQIKDFLSATEALEVLTAGGGDTIPDIIFLDLNMPIMDGWDFLDALEPLRPVLHNRCSIYILTSSLDASDAAKAKNYPIVSGLLHKPIMSEDINLILSQFPLRSKV